VPGRMTSGPHKILNLIDFLWCPTSNLKSCSSRPPKFMKNSEARKETKGNNSPFGLNFKIEMDFEL
jgi:hypothetical protein